MHSILSLGDVHPDVGGRSTSLWLLIGSSGSGGAVAVGNNCGCVRLWGCRVAWRSTSLWGCGVVAKS
jgi:hypothetical protein